MKQGLIEVYCGDGKGKTTAALGLALRASGRGMKIIICQFLKGWETGELKTLPLLPGVQLFRAPGVTKFSFQMTDAEKAVVRKNHDELLAKVTALCVKENTDILILDEALGACSTGLLSEAKLLQFLKTKPQGLEVVLTGRGPSQAILDAADYVSEIMKRKHPYDKGIVARDGIER
jgi:cob(I)alamin adenosyltransferase